jgi:hypothetical protein
VDVDFDSKKDLLVAPNAKNVSENETSIMKYKNTMSNTNPNFVFETKAFLQEDMIEHGTGSIPVLTDLDNDGLVDLFVANYFSYKPTLAKESRIAYYKNTGTINNPVFTFIDNDFLNLSQSGLGLRMVPSFGDLNNDGKKDIILGLENGTLCYLQNTTSGSIPTFSTPITNYQDHIGQTINVGQFATPQLFDLNLDGKLDLIIGKKTGEILYYQNKGTLTTPSFELINSNLGNVDVSSSISPDGFAVPHFFRNLDTTYLMVGSLEGAIFFYDSIDENLASGTGFRTISSNFLNQDKNIGGYSACAVGDLDNDSNLDLIIGQDLGGLFFLEHDSLSNLGLMNPFFTLPEIHIYPNPAYDRITITSDIDLNNFEIRVYSSTGKLVDKKIGKMKTIDFSITDYTNGMYFIQIPEFGYSTKFIKQ